MSDIEIYTIAKVAREKLLSEYSFKDHNLQRLVAHANLYDNLLVAYHKQGGDGPEKINATSSSAATRRVTFTIPSRPRLPRICLKDEGESESKDGRPKSSIVRKIEMEFCGVGDCDHSEGSEASTEVVIVEMVLEDDG